MVSQVHRFLYQQQPDKQGSPRVWVLHGPPIHDLYFHDLYRGCVDLRRTIELWGTEEWQGTPKPLTVTLTLNGELDFTGNADPDDARARFDAMRNPRPPRFGQRRTSTPREDSPTETDDEVVRQAEIAAAATQANIGGGQELINRMQQLGDAMASSSRDRIVVIVDELSHQLLRLESMNQPESVLQAQQIIVRDWVNKISARNALLVLLEFRSTNISPYLPVELAAIRRLELPGPRAGEVEAALSRTSRRKNFNLKNAPAVADFLAGSGDLRSALSLASRVVARGDDVSLEKVIDLPPINASEVQAILGELDSLTGLDSVKSKARELVERARQRRRRLSEDGDFPDETLHMVFTGSPGTGKTTVARIFARLYHALGLLATDRVTEVNASEGIKSSTVARTRENMQQKLEEALGGVLFIDEAHQFGDKDDFASKEAVEALVPMAWNHRNNLVIVLAGYSDKMVGFFDMDPGLPRRFPDAGRLEFTDYTADQLWQMMLVGIQRRGWSTDHAVENRFRSLLRRRAQRGNFGNAGGVDNLISEIISRHDARGDLSRTFVEADLPPILIRREQHSTQARRELDSMVGLTQVRDMLDTLVSSLAYDVQRGRATDGGSYRMLFVGPPGTGKTRVARLMADMLYGEGAITRNAFLEVNGVSLQGTHLGEAQAKVAKIMEEYRDGVVFIDEAYSICADDRDLYGKQALDELVGQLTRPENSGTVVILAGYEEAIDRLLRRNAGLLRRFDKRLRFSNYTTDECTEIARRILTEQEFLPGTGFFDNFRDIADHAVLSAGPDFGNAGWVRSTVEAAIEQMKRRVMRERIPAGDDRERTIEVADLEASSAAPAGRDISAAPATDNVGSGTEQTAPVLNRRLTSASE